MRQSVKQMQLDSLHQLQAVGKAKRVPQLPCLTQRSKVGQGWSGVVKATVDGDALSYSTGKVAVKRDAKFVKEVYKACGYSKNQLNNNKRLWCPVLGLTVPKGPMAVGHIFKHEFHRSGQIRPHDKIKYSYQQTN